MDEEKAVVVVAEDILEPEAMFVPLQLPGEPDAWYYKFLRYFVHAGAGRSVMGAYRMYVEDQHPERAAKATLHTAPRNWAAVANQYRWRERASEYDRHYANLSMDSVALALEILRDAAPDAAVALLDALNVPKTRVTAAREILDRVGVLRTTRQETVSVRITPDDLRKAREEADEWEKETFGVNG